MDISSLEQHEISIGYMDGCFFYVCNRLGGAYLADFAMCVAEIVASLRRRVAHTWSFSMCATDVKLQSRLA